MRNLYYQLEKDFKTCTGYTGRRPSPSFDLEGYRGYSVSLWQNRDLAYIYKWEYQLQNLFKRYRFKDDLYTDEELNCLTNKKEMELQLKLAMPRPEIHTIRTRPVISRVRSLMKKWLGPVNWDEIAKHCCFGTKATVGNPKSDAYYDVKTRVLTGSSSHISQFDDVVVKDPVLTRSLRNSERILCTMLEQVNVPKSYKILRGITPNTTIGAFLTKGIGIVLEDVCSEQGLSIRKTQARHRQYVKTYSKTRQYVTADLSAASQCYLLAHLNAMLPREWYRLIKLGRIADIGMGGVMFKSQSVMTMGIGFTFPLQTLLFAAILTAVRDLLGLNDKLKISVYGDDLIYPREMHKYVVRVFSDLGFSMNYDKTFKDSYFRESCGADFFNGIDVRPFSPEASYELLKGSRACSFLYKIYNGLMARWTPEELRYTRAYLERTILQHTPGIHQVPPSYPDTSGVKVCKPIWDRFWYPVLANINWGYSFCCIVETSKKRKVEVQDIYYWNALRRHQRETCTDIPILVRPLPVFFRLNSLRYHPAAVAASKRRALWLARVDEKLRNCEGEEAMQICWLRSKHSVWAGGKKRFKLRPFEVSRDDVGYTDATRETPMWA